MDWKILAENRAGDGFHCIAARMERLDYETGRGMVAFIASLLCIGGLRSWGMVSMCDSLREVCREWSVRDRSETVCVQVPVIFVL